MPGLIPPSKAGAQLLHGHGPDASILQTIWHVLKIIGTPNKDSAGAGSIGDLVKSLTGKGGPANIAMLLGGGIDSPLSKEPWLEDYSVPKAVAGGHVTFREHQPYDVQGALHSIKTNNSLLRTPLYGNSPSRAAMSAGNISRAQQLLHDVLFGGTTHVAPGFSIPPRP